MELNTKKGLLLAFTLFALVGCGGGGMEPMPVDPTPVMPEPPPPPPPPPEPKITLAEYSAGGRESPAFSAINDNGDQMDYYGNEDADGQFRLSQVVITTIAGDRVRNFYDRNGQITRINDERSGAFVLVLPLDNGQKLLSYRADGSYESGFAILNNADGTHAIAPVVGAPVFEGQLQLNLNGTPNQSAALVADSMAGLGTPEALPANLEAYLDNFMTAKSGNAKDIAGGLSRITSTGFTTWATLAALGTGAVLGGVTVPPVVGTIALIGFGASVVGYTTQLILKDAESEIDPSERSTFNEIFGSFQDVSTPDSLAQSARQFIRDVIDRGASATQRAAGDIAEVAGNAATTIASTFTNESAAPEPTSLPPPVAAELEGSGVDQANTIYDYSGRIEPDGTISTTGTAPNGDRTTVTGSLTEDSVNGSWTSVAMDGTTKGSGAVTGTAREFSECAAVQNSGGQGTFTVAYNLGSGGSSTFSYDAFSIPDSFSVRVGSTEVFTTGGLVSGTGGGDFALTSATVFVNVSAPRDGTAWVYNLSCAQ